MALNKQNFKTRATTAVVFVIAMLAGLLINHWSFLLLFTVIHFGCWIEFQKMLGNISLEYRQISDLHKLVVMVAGYAIMLWMGGRTYSLFGFYLNELGWWTLMICAIILPISEVLFSANNSLKALGISLLGLLYISFSWGCMMELFARARLYGSADDTPYKWLIPVLLIASIWINDTMAYIVGSMIGKTPFSKISPKKTWEGTAGGALLCIATLVLIGHFWMGLPDLTSIAVIAAIAAVWGTLGDLLESKLKRMAGIKDSGSLMPGHGGFLDRFDSLLLATPFVWVYFIFIQPHLH